MSSRGRGEAGGGWGGHGGPARLERGAVNALSARRALAHLIEVCRAFDGLVKVVKRHLQVWARRTAAVPPLRGRGVAVLEAELKVREAVGTQVDLRVPAARLPFLRTHLRGLLVASLAVGIRIVCRKRASSRMRHSLQAAARGWERRTRVVLRRVPHDEVDVAASEAADARCQARSGGKAR